MAFPPTHSISNSFKFTTRYERVSALFDLFFEKRKKENSAQSRPSVTPPPKVAFSEYQKEPWVAKSSPAVQHQPLLAGEFFFLKAIGPVFFHRLFFFLPPLFLPPKPFPNSTFNTLIPFLPRVLTAWDNPFSLSSEQGLTSSPTWMRPSGTWHTACTLTPLRTVEKNSRPGELLVFMAPSLWFYPGCIMSSLPGHTYRVPSVGSQPNRNLFIWVIYTYLGDMLYSVQNPVGLASE